VPYEHLGWLELRELDAFKPLLRHSINMNINTQPLNLLDKKLGLQFVSCYSMCDDPFGINVDIYGDNIKWTVYHDPRFIDADAAQSLLRDVQAVFNLIVDGDKDASFSVGDALRSIKAMR
jgi:hypothetical protein